MSELQKSQTSLKRFVLDFIVGLAIFAGAMGAIRVNESSAFPAPVSVELAGTIDALRLLGLADADALATSRVTIAHKASSPAFAVAVQAPSLATRPLSERSIFTLLALAFATVTALNMALVRHVRATAGPGRRRSDA
ncbi:MAG: hypothetical protein ABL898_04355 [Hyphomicrobiaceae bacterium]|nr:hypothetical protein [Hyphomicrobiaceae bacterium]